MRRLEVVVQHAGQDHLHVVPQVIRNLDSEELSVDKWSSDAVEKMFEAASEALKDDENSD